MVSCAMPRQLTWLMGGAALLRLVMILVGEWQDRHMEVKYTDIDYVVFTDAARFVWNGSSPFERYTYRYTPLLAYILLPNVFLHGCWGKLLFSAAELLVGRQIFALLRLRGVGEAAAAACTATWLFNPFTFTVATRGNCEALVSAMLLRLLLCLAQGRILEGAAWYGLAVHFRIYPIVYAPAILLHLNDEYAAFARGAKGKGCGAEGIGPPGTNRRGPAPPPREATRPVLRASQSASHSKAAAAAAGADTVGACEGLGGVRRRSGRRERPGEAMAGEQGAGVGGERPSEQEAGKGRGRWSAGGRHVATVLAREVNGERVLFSLLSGGIFLALAGLFWAAYRWQFLHEALLYHLTRTDPRHNFSIYFYPIYLGIEDEPSTAERLAAFLPQLGVQLFLAVRFAKDLPFCTFVQTVAFVAFNKVITAQYFVWFFCLLPIVLPTSSLRLLGWGAACLMAWIGAQLHWLLWAYILEFEGRNVYFIVWLASLVVYAATLTALAILIRNNQFVPQFHGQKPGKVN